MSAWLVLAIVGCAAGAICARRLVSGALWLMATSILVAVLLATLAAPAVAVVELSVGAGLVAVLFVFAIGVAGEEGLRSRPIVPRPLAVALAGTAMLLLAWLILPTVSAFVSPGLTPTTVRSLTDVLWHDRAADLLGQAALIVVAALAVRTILGDARTAPEPDRPRAVGLHAPARLGPIPVQAGADSAAGPASPAGVAVSSESEGAREEVPV